MNRAVIFINGDESDYSTARKYISKQTLLIGCDGGGEKILHLDLKPDVIIGDFDSFNKKMLKDAKAVELPRDKDYTDSEAAIRYALRQGASEVFITGFLGSRIDHMLGNIFLLSKPEFAPFQIKIIEGVQEIYMLSGTAEISGQAGEIISFLPLFGDVRAKSSSGLKYDLAEYTLSMHGNSGISNELVSDEAQVDLGRAAVLVIHNRS